RGSLLRTFWLHGKQREALVDIVMKLPGNPGTFFLMRFDQPSAHFGKSFLGQFALGDVPRDRGSADDHALLISDMGNSDSNVDSLATFRDTDRFVVVDPLTGCQASQNFLLLVVQFGRDEHENRLSNRFFLRVPKHLPRTSVPGSNRTLQAFRDDRVLGRLDNASVP